MNYRFYRYFSVGLRHHSNMSQHVTSKLPQPWYSYHVRCSPSMSQWSESSGPKTRVLSLTVQLWEGANGDACQGDGHPSMYGQTVGPILKQDNLCDSCSAETLENQWVSWRLILGFPFKKNEQNFYPLLQAFRMPQCVMIKKAGSSMPSTRLWILSWISCPARIWTRRASNTGGSWNWVIHGGNVRKRPNTIKT